LVRSNPVVAGIGQTNRGRGVELISRDEARVLKGPPLLAQLGFEPLKRGSEFYMMPLRKRRPEIAKLWLGRADRATNSVASFDRPRRIASARPGLVVPPTVAPPPFFAGAG
jgi:hypothetical protein